MVVVVSAALISIVLAFALVRVVTDWPHILAGTVPDDDFARRYVAHPWLAYLHIAPGVVYLLGAPLSSHAGSARSTTPCTDDWAACSCRARC